MTRRRLAFVLVLGLALSSTAGLSRCGPKLPADLPAQTYREANATDVVKIVDDVHKGIVALNKSDPAHFSRALTERTLEAILALLETIKASHALSDAKAAALTGLTEIETSIGQQSGDVAANLFTIARSALNRLP